MKFFTLYKIRSGTMLCLFLFSGIVAGQSYRFRNYGNENDLPSKVIYTLNQDNNGYLWIGTTEGVSRFDGFSFYKVQFPDSVSGRYPTSSLKDKKGNLWFGCNDGTLFYSAGRFLRQVSLPDSSGTEISTILEGTDGKIYVIPQHRPVYKIDPGKPSKADIISLDADPAMFTASFTGSGELLIGTQEGLMICKIEGDSIVIIGEVEDFDYSRIMSIHQITSGNDLIIGTDGNGIFKLSLKEGKKILSRFRGYPELESVEVNSIIQDSQNNIWISTKGNGAFKMQLLNSSDSIVSVSHIDKTSGLPGDNVMVLFEDSEENIWMGFNGDGLSILTTESFEFYTPGGNDRSNNIIYAGKLGADYFLGTPAGYYIYDLVSRKPKSFASISVQTVRNEINSYFIDSDDNIWIGTKGSGLYLKSKAGGINQFYRSGDTGADYITGISISGDNIWLATLNGVQIISRQNRILKESYNINNGLPHNSINQVIISENGSGYVATESDRIYNIDPGSGVTATGAPIYGTVLNKITSLSIDKTGIIWAATLGNGVFQSYGDSVKMLNTSTGLLSNYAYSVLADKENNIWIGHERGISRYNRNTGITKVYESDFARGGSCNANAIYETPDGKILFGTSEGLIIYDSSKDKKSQNAPVNNINSIIINNIEYPYQPSISLPYKKRYNVRISFTGINFSNPSKVFYSTFMENYNDDWQEISGSREVTYTLSNGRYKFNLVSVNEDGLTQETPLSFGITIKQPVWRSWWFILLLLGFASGIVVIIIREREKAQKKVQEYLEKELDARTKVVMDQKAELEHQNLEITDSINYARRIQSSILPDIKRLKEHFRDAFIMLYPCKIVSGDFYWFDKLDDDTVILVCADSTGHGVPGAFMSMIGATLLQDIVTRQRISKPSEILSMLDKQIFSMLNQNLEVGISNDGMDIVVCEFTLSNRHVRFASAMRPVLLVIGGETYYIKGNRSSVGGQSVLEKYFDDQEYYLNEGDMIYMFSDGLPDQFGGADGKKMKITRLKTIIGEISGLAVSQQEEALENFYKEWKGKYDQVDDILLMGVKV